MSTTEKSMKNVDSAKGSPLLTELGELRGVFMRFAGVFLALTLVMFLGSPSLAVRTFSHMQDVLVPGGVSLVALGPLSSFVAPISVALLVAFIIAFPYLLYSLLQYILPALFPSERRAVSSLFFFSVLLFFAGCTFAFFFLIPNTFAILYAFAEPLAVVPFFSLDAFIATVFGLTLMSGLLFLLPVVMVILSKIGIVSAAAWRSHWRIAVLGAIMLSAILTPDGSGVTMVILSVPLLLLYGIGVFASSRGGAPPRALQNN